MHCSSDFTMTVFDDVPDWLDLPHPKHTFILAYSELGPETNYVTEWLFYPSVTRQRREKNGLIVHTASPLYCTPSPLPPPPAPRPLAHPVTFSSPPEGGRERERERERKRRRMEKIPLSMQSATHLEHPCKTFHSIS